MARARRLKSDYGFIDMWRFFRKMYPHKKYSYKICKAVVSDFNKMAIESTLKTALDFSVGHFIIGVRKNKLTFAKKNSIPVDWKETKRIGKKVYMINSHTDGYIFRWRWRRSQSRVKNRTAYAFRATRANNRAIKKHVTEGYDYFSL